MCILYITAQYIQASEGDENMYIFGQDRLECAMCILYITAQYIQVSEDDENAL